MYVPQHGLIFAPFLNARFLPSFSVLPLFIYKIFVIVQGNFLRSLQLIGFVWTVIKTSERKTFSTCGSHIILQLLRFSESDGEFIKNVEPVLCKVLLKFTTEGENGTFSSRSFAMKAIVNHNGILSNGHYTVIVRDKAKDRWFHCDDHNVTPCGKKMLKSADVYLLFYQDVSLRNLD